MMAKEDFHSGTPRQNAGVDLKNVIELFPQGNCDILDLP